jgi:cysteine desulfurase family protein (TIGR01976 family)
MSRTTLVPHSAPNVAEIRASFPALQRKYLGFDVAYFDGPGGTQVPRAVVDAMNEYLLDHNANTHWDYPTSHETDALIADARQAMADLLGATPEEIAFGNNMTTLTFHLARALAWQLRPGDEIVITELDHHANVAPWQAIARDHGFTLRTVRMIPATGQLDWDDLERTITKRTRILALGAASNAFGTINDVRRAADLAHAHGARVYVDAVHYAPHNFVDVHEMGADFLACSAYKFYGPHIGILYGRLDLLQELDPPKLSPAPNDGALRLETGTQNHEGIVGAAAAVDFIASLGHGDDRRTRLRNAFDYLHHEGTRLVTRLWDALAQTPGVQLYGPNPDQPRTSTVSFTLDGTPADEVVRRLASRGVFASHGDFYATTAVQRLGIGPDGLVRAGAACYTTDEEIDRLIDGIRASTPR